MDPVQRFLDQFGTSSEAESRWLRDIFAFITQHLRPLFSGPAPPCGETGGGVCSHQLSVCVVKTIQENMCVTHVLPVSYRFISISELISQQHLPCVSNISWSTTQQKEWVKGAELSLPGHQALPRVNLLLIGCLQEGRGGEWRLTDASGSVRCECLSPSPLWLNHPVFLPHWNYIPHNAPGQEQEEAEGHVELIGSPVLLCPVPEKGPTVAGPGPELIRAVGVREAAGFLHNRTRGLRVSVYGHVGSVCPLLVVAGTTFFCFSLTEAAHSLPVLVKDNSRLWWSECVRVGQHVCVTSLRVCVLRGWRGNKILCVTNRSEIHTDYTHTPSEDTPPPVMSSHVDHEDSEEVEPQRDIAQSAVRIKRSTVISYQGTVTEVVSAGAGLYVIDGKVGLCLAYQPPLRRKLRAGDAVQIDHVHFLYQPSPDFPPSMLCTCLRSSLRVTTFSRVGGSSVDSRCPGDGVLPRLLLEKNMSVSEYLWTCNVSSQLMRSLVPTMLKQCVCVLSWKLLESAWRPRRGDRRRDIYSEMFDEPHVCPLAQYSSGPAVPQYISVSELCRSLHSDCWSSLSLSSLLPPGGSGLTRSQINTVLAWSFNVQTGDRLRQRPLLLVGVLELPSQRAEHTLQLRDGTAAVACIVTESCQGNEAGQTAVFNTAWIGCLLCIQHFTVVTERFIQSDFPSYQHLDQNKYITNKNCRVYLQLSLDHIHILSPSAAMVTHLHQRGQESGDDVTGRSNTGQEEEMEGGEKRRRREEEPGYSLSAPDSVRGRPCVSIVIKVERKEGVAWRNTGVGLKDGEAGLLSCFSVRAVVIGPVVTWGWDPKNSPMTERETEKGEGKVVLLFSGVTARWSPVLQPGSFYRLVAANTQDPCVLVGSGVSAHSRVELHSDSTLHIRPDWRFHTLTWPLLLPVYRQVKALLPTVLSVSEVLESSCDLVCFQALVSDRISVTDESRDCGDTKTGVRLTVCDQNGRGFQVYLELNHTPYPPGLLPGNTLLFSAFQRKLSRTGSVYCSYLPVSSISVVTVGDSSSAGTPPAPMMHLGVWAGSAEKSCTVGQVKGHVVCVLYLQLQWICSLCGSVYRQSCCSSQCRSTSSVFQSKAKLVLDDGTGEAHVWFSGALVHPLLGLDDSQWEGLQRALRVRGHLEVYPWGQNLVCDDALLHFLLCVCSSEVVCRQLSLTCRKLNRHRSEEMKRFSRGDRDFMTRMTRPLQLTCLHIN